MKKNYVLILLIIFLRLTGFSQNCNYIGNGNFESPVFPSTPAYFTSASMGGWLTTSPDGQMELWNNGFQGVPSYSGAQHMEIDAFYDSTVYQDIVVNPGTYLAISFAHRGRAGVDTMSVSAGPVGGPYTTLGVFPDSTSWGYYTVSYLVPNMGNNYSIRFNPLYATGVQGLGNFLDSVTVCATNVGMNEMAQNGNSVSVFPSLFADELNVIYKGKESLQFILYDITARVTLNLYLTGSAQLNTDQLAKGIYLYELRNKNGLIEKGKVVKD